MNPDFAVEGTGEPNTRLDIDDFSTNVDYRIRWGLFLQAMAKLQLAGPDDPLGYYRVAGIHGSPRVTWPDLKVQPGKTMYCSHEITRFVTWHRAYSLLIEQCIVKTAIGLAPPEYIEEAKKIRIPYWDFAKVAALPACAVEEDAKIWISPTQQITIKNPLVSYTFTGPPDDGMPKVTVRDANANANLAGAGLRPLVYHALTTRKEYAPFSNIGYPAYDSIEIPHNSVHRAVGGSMLSPLVTAFDPLFWSFHVIIDRYYALWQTINPTVLYGENHEGADTIDYWLGPFERATAGQWTSRMVQKSATHDPNTWVFGVQYPETLVQWTNKEREDAAWAAIRTYAPPITHKAYPPGAIPKKDRFVQPSYPDDLPDVASLRREWRVVIKVKNDLVEDNFTIFIFLGDSGESPADWDTAVSTVGSFSTFKAPLESCSNCQEKSGQFIYGAVYLTDKLHDLLPHGARLENKATLTPWLISKLDWRIRQADGTEVFLPAGNTESLSVGVESFIEAYAPVDGDGNYMDCDPGKIIGRTFDRVRHPDITRGKANKGGDIIIH